MAEPEPKRSGRTPQEIAAENIERLESARVVHLPVWPERTRGLPNAMLRSALFAVIERGARRHMKNETVATLDGIKVSYTGEQLDQADLDLWAALLHLCRPSPLGDRCKFTGKQILDALGKSGGGRGRVLLDEQLTRLTACAVKISFGRGNEYTGSLVTEYGRAATSGKLQGHYIVVLNPKLAALFQLDQFTQVDWYVRRALAGKPLAMWLHAFYASHAEPFSISVARLRELSGSGRARERDFKRNLTKAFDALSAALNEHGQPFRYAFERSTQGTELVYVERTATRSQRKHLALKLLR